MEGASTPLVWIDAASQGSGWLHHELETRKVFVGSTEIGQTLTPHEAILLECALIGKVSVEGVVSVGDIRDTFANVAGSALGVRIAETVTDRMSARFQNYFTLDLIRPSKNVTDLHKVGVVLNARNNTKIQSSNRNGESTMSANITTADANRIAKIGKGLSRVKVLKPRPKKD